MPDVTLHADPNKTAALLPTNLNRALAVERVRDLRLRSRDQGEVSARHPVDHADRWVAIAAASLLTLGVLNVLEGLSVVAHVRFAIGIHFLPGSLNTRGWIALSAGGAALVVGTVAGWKIRHWRRAALVTLAMGAIAQLVMIPNYPGWLLGILTLDLIPVFGLIAAGSSSRAARRQSGLSPTSTPAAIRPLLTQQNKPAGAGFRPDEQPGEDRPERQTRQWRRWRRCAQDVTRSWNEWLAADRFRSAECYRRYVSALDQEERAAAEFERVFLRVTGKGRE